MSSIFVFRIIFVGKHLLETIEIIDKDISRYLAMMTSGMEDMPTTSAPKILIILYSAGVSSEGPCQP